MPRQTLTICTDTTTMAEPRSLEVWPCRERLVNKRSHPNQIMKRITMNRAVIAIQRSFLVLASFSCRSQALKGMLPHSNLAKTQKFRAASGITHHYKNTKREPSPYPDPLP